VFPFALVVVAQTLAQKPRVPGELPLQVPYQTELSSAVRTRHLFQAGHRYFVPDLFGALVPYLVFSRTVHLVLLSFILVPLLNVCGSGCVPVVSLVSLPRPLIRLLRPVALAASRSTGETKLANPHPLLD
jgi:hypothetical protein